MPSTTLIMGKVTSRECTTHYLTNTCTLPESEEVNRAEDKTQTLYHVWETGLNYRLLNDFFERCIPSHLKMCLYSTTLPSVM